MSEPSSDSPPRATSAPEPEDPQLVNTLREHGPGRLVFGRFRLQQELGRGGMAVVWLAQDERLGLRVALKFLPGMIASDPEALDDLRREITRGLQLTHPGIVRLYDLHVDEGEGLAAIAMEYVDGSTLGDEKTRQPGRCFDIAEPLLFWARELCEVLSYVHGRVKIVHRDLKPRNVMLNAAGDLKIADFGIAATLCDSHSRVTKNPGTSGTPVYMSPQQAMGKNPSTSDDIYALGATFYELITSKPPFFRGSMAIILNQVATQVPPSMAERRTELGVTGRAPIPAAWEETIAACLAKEPGDRPANTREVAARLGLVGGAQASVGSVGSVGFTATPTRGREPDGPPPKSEEHMEFQPTLAKPAPAPPAHSPLRGAESETFRLATPTPTSAQLSPFAGRAALHPDVIVLPPSHELEDSAAERLLWGGFTGLLAAAFGIGLRFELFRYWGQEFALTGAQLGKIAGSGFGGLLMGTLLAGFLADRLGYGRLIACAIIGHLVSAALALGVEAPETAATYFYWGMFVFGLSNGLLQSTLNPLVATLFPGARTRNLNLLHAGWPAGALAGALIGLLLNNGNNAHWKFQLFLSLVPTAICALLFYGQDFPTPPAVERNEPLATRMKPVGLLGAAVVCALLSVAVGDFFQTVLTPADATPEAAAQMVSTAQLAGRGAALALVIGAGVLTRFSFGSILLAVLLFLGIVAGAAEKGIDGFFPSIATADLTKLRFFFLCMTALVLGARLSAGFLERVCRLSPALLLLAGSLLAGLGVFLMYDGVTFPAALTALACYSVGKAFFQPTLLGLLGDRLPQTGALAMSLLTALFLLAGSFLGTKGLEYGRARFSGEALSQSYPAVYLEFASAEPVKLLELDFTAASGLDPALLRTAKATEPRTEPQQLVVDAEAVGNAAMRQLYLVVLAGLAVVCALLAWFLRARPVVAKS